MHSSAGSSERVAEASCRDIGTVGRYAHERWLQALQKLESRAAVRWPS